MRTIRPQSFSHCTQPILLITSLLTLTGCSTIEIKLGTRVALAKTPVVSIEASQYKGPGIGPGKKSSLIVDVTDSTGKVLVTEGKGKGKVLWKDLTVTPTVVSYKKGVISLAADPRLSDGKTAHVTITVPIHPGVQTELDIPLRYNYAFVANYSGASGSSGINGTDGSAGSSGSPGSLDPNNPSPGGNGGDGGNGTDGGNGSDGSDGPPVTVFATLRPGDHPLLQIGIISPAHKREHFYLVDPQGGSLTINDNGGSGGSGGKGGSGGSGGSGGIGSPSGSNGNSGTSGHDGSSGSDGRGGTITLTYDPSVQPFLSTIHLLNSGGPPPTLTPAPVPPLW